jgi:2-methylcitrate dehydratase PrpD
MAGGMPGALAVDIGAATAIAAMTGGDPEAVGGAVGFSGISRRVRLNVAVTAQPKPQILKIV